MERVEDLHLRSAAGAREAALSPSAPGGGRPTLTPHPIPQGAPGPTPAVRRSSGLPLADRSGLLLLHVQPHFPAEHDGLRETGKRKH